MSSFLYCNGEQLSSLRYFYHYKPSNFFYKSDSFVLLKMILISSIQTGILVSDMICQDKLVYLRCFLFLQEAPIFIGNVPKKPQSGYKEYCSILWGFLPNLSKLRKLWNKDRKGQKKKAYTGYVVFEFIVANIVLKFENYVCRLRRSEDKLLQELILFFHCLSPGFWTQFIRLGTEAFYKSHYLYL